MKDKPKNCDLNCYNYMGALADVRRMEKAFESAFHENIKLAEKILELETEMEKWRKDK